MTSYLFFHLIRESEAQKSESSLLKCVSVNNYKMGGVYLRQVRSVKELFEILKLESIQPEKPAVIDCAGLVISTKYKFSSEDFELIAKLFGFFPYLPIFKFSDKKELQVDIASVYSGYFFHSTQENEVELCLNLPPSENALYSSDISMNGKNHLSVPLAQIQKLLVSALPLFIGDGKKLSTQVFSSNEIIKLNLMEPLFEVGITSLSFFESAKSIRLQKISILLGVIEDMQKNVLNVETVTATPSVHLIDKEVIAFVQCQGIGSEKIKKAEELVLTIISLVQVLKLDGIKEVVAFLNNTEGLTHSQTTVFVLSFLLQEFGFQSRKTLLTAGLAGFFHDISLISDPYKVEMDERALSDSGFLMHPIRSSDILKPIREIDPIVHVFIKQHHERSSGRGFPNKVNSSELNLISELLGFSEAYTHLLFSKPNLNKIQFQAMKERIILQDFKNITHDLAVSSGIMPE